MKRSRQSEEHHEFQFRGIWLPPKVLAMIFDETLGLNATDMRILFLVEAFVKGANGECWATDVYLARRCSVDRSNAHRSVAKLRRLKLLKCKEVGKKRFLWTSWSKAGETESSSRNERVAKTQQECCENATRRVAKTHTEEREDRKQRNRSPRHVTDEERDEFSSFENSSTPEKELSTFLHDQLQELGKLTRRYKSLAQWRISFHQLLEVKDLKLVWDMVKDHLANIEDPYQPKFYSGPTFCEGFSRVEDAYKRRKHPKKQEVPADRQGQKPQVGEVIAHYEEDPPIPRKRKQKGRRT